LVRNVRLVSAFVAVAFVASACVHNKQPEPGVRAISTDLKYQSLQKKSAAPANTVPVAPPSLGPPPTIPPFVPGDIGPSDQPVTCPTAAPTAQAQEDVTGTVASLPRAGEYLWRVSGVEKSGKNTLALPTSTKRSVENVKGTVNNGQAESTFETVERELSATNPSAPFVRSFFQVTGKTTTDNTVREGGQSSGRTSTAGVKLTKIVRQVPGGATTTFVASTPIRYLITPVILGKERFWMDQAVDTSGSTPQTLTHRAYVKGRVTIDACGQRLRGWLVVADQTYQAGSDRITRHFEYGVATQMGGIVVYEDVQSPCTTMTNGKCSDATLVYKANYGKASD
jgi:hypothetical protein